MCGWKKSENEGRKEKRFLCLSSMIREDIREEKRTDREKEISGRKTNGHICLV